tara:strand:+ start:135 stop:467 length:333 start_codon:yes stop_codon:yes gene_type:complete
MWFDILKRKGRRGKSTIGEWIKTFIRNHLESMAVGEKITTAEMVELLNKNIGEATYLDSNKGTQVRFSQVRVDRRLTMGNISNILMRQNKDIVDVARTPNGRPRGYVVRK